MISDYNYPGLGGDKADIMTGGAEVFRHVLGKKSDVDFAFLTSWGDGPKKVGFIAELEGLGLPISGDRVFKKEPTALADIVTTMENDRNKPKAAATVKPSAPPKPPGMP